MFSIAHTTIMSQDEVRVHQAYMRGKMDGLMKAHQCVQDTAAVMAVNPMSVVQHLIGALIHEICATKQHLARIDMQFSRVCVKDASSGNTASSGSRSQDLIEAYREADKLKFQKQLLSQRDHEVLYEDIDL